MGCKGEIGQGAKRRAGNEIASGENHARFYLRTKRIPSPTDAVILFTKPNPFRDSFRSSQQIKAIHDTDPDFLVTIGSANPAMIRPDSKFQNYWSDECMNKALGTEGERFLDFYQIHVYPDGDTHMGVWKSFHPSSAQAHPRRI